MKGNYVDSFIDLTSKLTHPTINIEDKLVFICKFTKELAPKANRVSLWRFDKMHSKIICVMCYDATKNEFSSGQEIDKYHYISYFNEILQSDVINASDARSHPATSCFNKDYFEPLDIHSLLDFILHKDFAPAGVICCESVGKKVNWCDADVKVLERVARASSMYFKLDG